MPDYMDIYANHAAEYEMLIAREDYKNQLPYTLKQIAPFERQDVVEFGAGTGRLTCMLAPIVQTIRAYDSSAAMLAVMNEKLTRSRLNNWYTDVADHRSVSATDTSADIAISGWSMCYLALNSGPTWKEELNKGLLEMQRVVRPGGTIIIIETQGTGEEKPKPPKEMKPYFDFLRRKGFKNKWIRTDYLFKDMNEAKTLTNFFFGEAMLPKLSQDVDGICLPECTGIWWRPRGQKLF